MAAALHNDDGGGEIFFIIIIINMIMQHCHWPGLFEVRAACLRQKRQMVALSESAEKLKTARGKGKKGVAHVKGAAWAEVIGCGAILLFVRTKFN